jgi:NADH-quinone oxidoreductase subunit N
LPPITPPPVDLLIVGPIAITAVTAMVALLLELVVPGPRKATIAHVSLAGVVLAALSALPLWNATRPPAYSGMVVGDNISVFVTLVCLGITALTLLMAPGFLTRAGMHHGEFYALLLLCCTGMLLLAVSGDLIVVFLGIELLSISLYVLSGFARTTTLAEIGRAVAALPAQENPLLLIGLGLLLVGFGFKLALVPFHQWTPDVYDGAPTLVTAFMSVGTKAAVFAALIRVLGEALPGVRADWQVLLWVLAAATMLLGNIAAVAQTEIKRLLAYSSIGQAGYVLAAVYAGTTDGWGATLFYLLAYAVMNLGAFAVVMAVGLRGEANRYVSNYSGLFQRQPLLAVAMTVFLLSLAGIPPTAGFWAKFYAFRAAIGAGDAGLWLALIGILSSVIAAYYYLRVAITLYRAPEAGEAVPAPTTPKAVPAAFLASLVIALLLTLQIGLFPTPQFDAARQAGAAIPVAAPR